VKRGEGRLQEESALRDFYNALADAVDETITGMLGEKVLASFYEHLSFFASITRDEMPYRIDTVLHVFERNFGVTPSNVLCRAITRRFYSKLGLQFVQKPNRNLLDYVEEAKITLGMRDLTSDRIVKDTMRDTPA
jgi:hypothetical protein